MSRPPAELAAGLRQLPSAVAATVMSEFGTVAELVADEARCSLGANGPAPSAPGEPPADPAGHLAAAIAVSVASDGAAVTVDMPYARDLEYGTVHMAARPFLRPAVDAASDDAKAALAEAFAKAVAITLDEHA